MKIKIGDVFDKLKVIGVVKKIDEARKVYRCDNTKWEKHYENNIS